MGRLTVRARDGSAGRRGPGAWAQLPRGNLRLRLQLGGEAEAHGFSPNKTRPALQPQERL